MLAFFYFIKTHVYKSYYPRKVPPIKPSSISLIITLKMKILFHQLKIKANHIKKAIKHYVRWP